MPKRQVVFQNDNYYHIFNKSIGSQNIFVGKRHCDRAMSLLDYYRYKQDKRYSYFCLLSKEDKSRYLESSHKQKPLLEIHAFSLMPNHFHFLVKQNLDNGIVKFTSCFQNGFAKFFNLKNNRSGSLFNHMFKAVMIEDEDQLLHLSRYIHLNPVTASLVRIEDLANFPYNSFGSYLDGKNGDLVTTSVIKNCFSNVKKYKKFVADRADYQKKIADIKLLILEDKKKNYLKKTLV